MSSLHGTALLLRYNARRDRVLVPVWVLILAGLSFFSAAATTDLYSSEADRVRAADAINKAPAIVALYGPILDVHSQGELAMTKMTVLYAVLAAILFIVLVRRHTRMEEEAGRAELVAGTTVGRDAPLAAAVAESVIVAVVLGLLVAGANIVGGLDQRGSVVFGCLWFGTGLVASGIAALSVQVSASARTCGAAAAGAVGLLFVIRAAGDASGATWLSWFSPFGWNTRARAWSGTRWWVLALYPALAAILVAAAQGLRSRRDVDAGLFAPRTGPATGSPRLADAVALAVRVHRTALSLWTCAVAVLGLMFGFIAPSLDDLLDSQQGRQLLDRLGGEMLAAVLSVVAVVVSCFGIAVLSHAGSDEVGGRAEEVLATATSRIRWLAASLLVALLGSSWLLLITGVTLWGGEAAAGGAAPGELIASAVGWSPAVWVVVALAAVLLALRGSWAVLGWAWPILFLTLTVIGELAGLPGWLTGLSPYSHVPHMPTQGWRWAPELGLTAVAAVLLAGAFVRFRGRDIG